MLACSRSATAIAAHMALVVQTICSMHHELVIMKRPPCERSMCLRHGLKLLNNSKLGSTCCRAFIGAERATLPEANDAAAVPLVAWSAQPQVCAPLRPFKAITSYVDPLHSGQFVDTLWGVLLQGHMHAVQKAFSKLQSVFQSG